MPQLSISQWICFSWPAKASANDSSTVTGKPLTAICGYFFHVCVSTKNAGTQPLAGLHPR